MVGRRDDRLGTAHRPLPVPRDAVSPPELIDTHVHLHFPEFTSDLPDVLTRAREAGVTRMVTSGSDVASPRAAIELAIREAIVCAAVGIHSHDACEGDG